MFAGGVGTVAVPFRNLPPPVLFEPMRWQPHTTPLWSPDPPLSRVLPYEKIFAELAWSRSKPYQNCINVRHRTDKAPVVSRIFYGNTINNSETVVQYAGHFALRLANLGLSASSRTDACPRVCWRSLVMRFDSTEGRRITWRRPAPSGASRVRGRRHHQGVDHQRDVLLMVAGAQRGGGRPSEPSPLAGVDQ
jgi:hypothetical protein